MYHCQAYLECCIVVWKSLHLDPPPPRRSGCMFGLGTFDHKGEGRNGKTVKMTQWHRERLACGVSFSCSRTYICMYAWDTWFRGSIACYLVGSLAVFWSKNLYPAFFLSSWRRAIMSVGCSAYRAPTLLHSTPLHSTLLCSLFSTLLGCKTRPNQPL